MVYVKGGETFTIKKKGRETPKTRRQKFLCTDAIIEKKNLRPFSLPYQMPKQTQAWSGQSHKRCVLSAVIKSGRFRIWLLALSALLIVHHHSIVLLLVCTSWSEAYMIYYIHLLLLFFNYSKSSRINFPISLARVILWTMPPYFIHS